MAPFTPGEEDATSAQNGIGTRLRATRERLGWNRETLAFHSGISWSAIAQVEVGRRTNLRPGTLQRLARALGVTIDYLVAGSAGPAMLDHRMLLYHSKQEFADAAIPFLADGVEAGEPVLVVSDDANIALLQEGLGRSARNVEFVEASGWYRTPGHAIQRYRTFVEDEIEAGAPWVRILGELGRGGLAASELRWWSSYEALLNLVLGSHPVTVLCPYDAHALGDEAVRMARLTHPHELENGALVPCAEFADPAGFVLER